ncbi:MAG: LPS export ABC transporter permease LptG [Parvularculaceae bacterium]
MSYEWTLFRYIFARCLRSVAFVFAAFFALVVLVDIIELLRSLASRDGVGFSDVLIMSFLRGPNLAEQLLPFSLLFGALWAFAQLNRHAEIVVMRSSGLSAWRIVAPAVAAAIAIGLGAVFIINPISSKMMAKAEEIRTRMTEGERSLITVSPTGGLWLRQAEADRQYVIHAAAIAEAGERFERVAVWAFDNDQRFEERYDAPSALIVDGALKLQAPLVARAGRPIERAEELSIPTPFTKERIQESAADPNALSIWELPAFIRLARAAGLSSARYQLQQHKLMALPFELAAMVLIAAAFSLRPMRSGGAVRLIIFGVVAGFAVYILADVANEIGRSGRAPAMLAAWTPALAGALFAITAILHFEDG